MRLFIARKHRLSLGVLQRIALRYGLAAVLYISGGTIPGAVAVGIAMFSYAWLMLHVPVPGIGGLGPPPFVSMIYSALFVPA